MSYCFSINVKAFKFHHQWSLNYIYSQNKIKISRNKLWGFAIYAVQISSLFKTTASAHGFLFNRYIRHGTVKGLGLSKSQSNVGIIILGDHVLLLGHLNPLITKTFYKDFL